MIGIYKITNKINGKQYIGQSINLEHRLNEHRRCEGDSYIHNAIKKYGLENFDFEIIELTSKELLNEREKFWIAYYDSYNKGYNLTLGGEEVSLHPSRPVNQYDLNGNFIQRFESIMDASRATGAPSGKICMVCNKERNTAAGFQWRYPNDEPPVKAKLQKRAVDQYSLEGTFLQTWDSAKAAGRYYNIDPSGIGHVCKGVRKTAAGYVWRYHDND